MSTTALSQTVEKQFAWLKTEVALLLLQNVADRSSTSFLFPQAFQ